MPRFAIITDSRCLAGFPMSELAEAGEDWRAEFKETGDIVVWVRIPGRPVLEFGIPAACIEQGGDWPAQAMRLLKEWRDA